MRPGGARSGSAEDGIDQFGRRDASSPPARIGRRRFVALVSQTWLTIPIASWLLVGCGGDPEERAATDTASDASGRSDDADARDGQATGSKQMAQAEKQAQEPAEASPQAAQAPSPSPSPEPAPAAEEALVTEISAMAGLAETVNYQHESPKPDQSCANCELYTKKTDERGSCKLFAQGLVEARGWCTSWIKKANAG